MGFEVCVFNGAVFIIMLLGIYYFIKVALRRLWGYLKGLYVYIGLDE